LESTIAHTVAEVDFLAVADGVTGRATKLAASDADHVVDASLTALGEVRQALGHGGTGSEGKDGKGLHLGD